MSRWPSRTKRTRSAAEASARAFSRTLSLKGSSATPKRPPVSTRVKRRPPSVHSAARLSRVMPGSEWTRDLRRPRMRLNRVDLPTLGKPTMTTRGSFVTAGPRSLRDERGIGQEGPRQVDVSAQGFPLGAVDEEDDLLDRLEGGDQRVNDGVDRGQLGRRAVGEVLGDLAAEVDRRHAVPGDEDLADLGAGRQRRGEALLRAAHQLGQGPLGFVGRGRAGQDLARLLVQEIVLVDEEEGHDPG